MRRPALSLLVNPEGVTRLMSWALGTSLLMLADGYVLVVVSRSLGLYLLLALVAVTGLFGLILVLTAYRSRVREIRTAVAEGTYPRNGFRRVLSLLVAAACLIVPGLATDAVGLLVLISPPPVSAGALLEYRYRRSLEELYEFLRLER